MTDHRLAGIDLAKHVFQLCVLDGRGKEVSNKRMSRQRLGA